MTSHAEQVASVLKRSIQDVLTRGLADPRVRGLISVTEVKLSPDMTTASVAISVIPEQHARLTLKGIQHAATHIRSQVSRAIQIRRMPRLSFRLDESLKKQAAIHAAINQAVGPGEEEQADGGERDRRGLQSEDTSQ